jgi:hypothetical protein
MVAEAVPSELIDKVIGFQQAALQGDSAQQTASSAAKRDDVKRALEAGGWNDNRTRTLERWIDDFESALNDGTVADFAKADENAVLARAVLNGPSSGTSAARVLEAISAQDYLPEHQSNPAGEAFSAELAQLPSELVLSLRTAQSKPDDASIRYLVQYFTSEKGKHQLGLIRRKEVTRGLLRVASSTSTEIRKDFLSLLELALDRAGDEKVSHLLRFDPRPT